MRKSQSGAVILPLVFIFALVGGSWDIASHEHTRGQKTRSDDVAYYKQVCAVPSVRVTIEREIDEPYCRMLEGKVRSGDLRVSAQ